MPFLNASNNPFLPKTSLPSAPAKSASNTTFLIAIAGSSRLLLYGPAPIVPYVRLIVLGNAPRHAIGFRTSDAGQTMEICHCHSDTTHLTPIFSCEACSGFTLVTARNRPRLPLSRGSGPASYPARQLPDQSTTHWVESSSTSDTRLLGHQISHRS